jgi:polyferredoxin
MDKVGRPRGLIGYDTEDNINRRLKGESSRFNLIRPRTIFYGGIFAIVSCVIFYGLLTRHTIGVNVIRDRAPLFVTLSDGKVRNAYTLKILNMSGADRNVAVSVEGIKDGQMEAETGKIENNEVLMETKPNKVSVVRMFMVAEPDEQSAKSVVIKVKVRDLKTKETATSKSVFITGTD